MACIHHFTLLKRFSATLLAFSDARSGHGQVGPSRDAGEWRSDGRADWEGAERTYYRRARAMPAAVLAGDRLPRRPCDLGEQSSRGVESTVAAQDTGRRTSGIISANLEDPPAVARCHASLRCGPGLVVEGASWSSERDRPPRDIKGSDVGKWPLAGVSSGW